MHFLKEFRDFINRGNVLDMGIGIIMGTSFTKIVNVLVKNILMPPIGIVLGGVDFSDLKIILKKASEKGPAVTVDYGMFINTLLDFVIVSFCAFIVIKSIGKLRRNIVEQNEGKTCPFCTMLIATQAKKCPHCTADLTPEDLSI